MSEPQAQHNNFGHRSKVKSSNARANHLALKSMTQAQRETGLTPEELEKYQASLRTSFYDRREAS
jgi:hypothetical protein